ncbi:hypothetical protein GVX81_02610 [[Haemophilus] felis]|uniref:Ribbon-helix-helix protein CopG domain-containing protein n=1 Tax=[Haemophilus] felis TaxID=123822 RepID=A0A1T0B223_9PAST|nr:hypothetical protein [[Haemophilus] felis]NBI40197.1 hypothetical protein [[Haemophilus] felis]OOS04134.1 hypothetical protein B0188_05570 [[Haemophilus] felis]
MAQLSETTRKRKIERANEWNKIALENGVARRILMQLPAEVADEFDAIAKELGLSRPQAIKRLCEVYRSQAVA